MLISSPAFTAQRPVCRRAAVGHAVGSPRLSVRAAAQIKQRTETAGLVLPACPLGRPKAGSGSTKESTTSSANHFHQNTQYTSIHTRARAAWRHLRSSLTTLPLLPPALLSSPAELSPSVLPLAWAGVLLSSTSLPAWADEAAAPVEAAAEGVQAVTEAAAEAAPAPTWLSYIGAHQCCPCYWATSCTLNCVICSNGSTTAAWADASPHTPCVLAQRGAATDSTCTSMCAPSML